jgi:hypothetical protein
VVELLRAHPIPPPGLQMTCTARRVKQDLMPAPFTVQAAEKGPCAVQLLWQYWHVCQAEGHPLQDYLFRPLRRDGKGFEERRGSCSAYNKRVKAIFTSIGVAYQPTPHGGRRGACQSAASHGATDEDIANLSRIKTPKVRAWYLDPTRHNGGALKRVRRGQHP